MPLQVIDRTTGTNIGNMTLHGGLSAAFDGQTNENAGECVACNNSGFIGKTLATKARFGRATIYGSNNFGFAASGGQDSQVTINIRGKNGTAPANRTDGTIVGTITFADNSDETAGRVITSTDTVTEWDHLFADIDLTIGGGDARIAELILERYYPGNMIAVLL